MAGSFRYLIAADSEVKSIAVTSRVRSPVRSESDAKPGLQGEHRALGNLAIITISVEAERIIPSSIRKGRILCERSVSSATLTGSRSNTRPFIPFTPVCLFYDSWRHYVSR